ncbi:MAG: ROK family transcriptional regulator [Anaerolineae bacterium]|nr:ROK family transcriptional regulator [Anaerolineae bacterium]
MGKQNSVDHAAMRDMNISLILNTLHNESPLSRIGLANRTGLNKGTISVMVKDLLAVGLIREIGTDASSTDVGRPAIFLEPNPDAGSIIGVEIGVDYISIITVNFAIEIISRRYESTLKYISQQAIIDRILFLLKETYEQAKKNGRPVFGVGIGVPGLVDMANGRLLFAPNLGWEDVPIKALVESAIDAPVFVANEANLAALGESYFGAGQNSSFLLSISSGVGVGGGIILNGRLAEGVYGFAGEVGHMTVQQGAHAIRCNCGNYGCWETVAGRQALFSRIETAIHNGRSSWITEVIGNNMTHLSVPLIVEAARRNDQVALDALQETGEWLGIGIASLINIINPERVIFGGALISAFEFLLPTMAQTVNDRTWPWIHEGVNIVAAKHGEDASVMGSVAIVYRDVLNNPRKWLQ